MRITCGVVVVAASVLATSVAAQSSPVYPGGVLDFLTGQAETLVADFNRDGVADVVAVVQDVDGVVWSHAALGRGNGQFDLKSPEVLTSGDTGDFAVADLNGDGFCDLVGFLRGPTPTSPSDILVALGLGDGRFDLLLSLPLLSTSAIAFDIEVVDIDVDGIADAIFWAGNEVFVIRGRGDGVFEPEELAFSLPADKTISALATGDLDGDGTCDLVLGEASPGAVLILRGLGNGAFSLVDQRAVPEPAGFAIADLDGDNDLDVAVSSFAPGETTVIPGQGDLTFGASMAVNTTQPTRDIVAGDYDNDGVIDLVASNPSGAVVNFMRGFGGGSFATVKNDVVAKIVREITPVHLNGDLATDWVITNGVSMNSVVFALGRPGQTSLFPMFDKQGPGVSKLIVADMNGDGADDRVYLRESDGVFISLWEGDGYDDQVSLGFLPARDLAVGDINGDGVPDIVSGAPFEPVVHAYTGVGDGTFTAPSILDFAYPGFTGGLAVGDLDLDGDAEIAYAVTAFPEGDSIFILDANTAGALSLVDTVTDVDIEGSYVELMLHDIDHDGALDLFALSHERRFESRLGVGGTTQFQPAIVELLPANVVPPLDFVIGRFENFEDDLVDDIVFLRRDGFRAYAGRAAIPGDLELIPAGSTKHPEQVFVAGEAIDRDGDDVLELVVSNFTDQTLLVFEAITSFGFLDFDVVERLAIQARVLGVGRVNDDELDDIVTLSGTGRVAFGQPPLAWDAVGGATAPVGAGLPSFFATGDPSPGSPVRLEYSNGLAGVQPILIVGLDTASIPLQGGVVVPSPDILIPLPFTDGLGDLALDVTWTNFPPGIHLWTQVWQVAGPNTHASNALTVESR